MAHDAFISYSHEDKLAADAACATLEAAGIRCWMAPRDISPGAEWGEAIAEAIDHSSVMVLIFSSNSNESRQIRREVERAVHAGVAIVPVRIAAAEPKRSLAYFMAGVHWLDAIDPPLEQHLQGLSTSIKARLQASRRGAKADRSLEEEADEQKTRQESVPDKKSDQTQQQKEQTRAYSALGRNQEGRPIAAENGYAAKLRVPSSRLDDAVWAPKLPGIPTIEGDPQFQFFVVGARGSGKTVLLASLFNQLTVPLDDNYFFAKLISEKQVSYLREIYRSIQDPDQPWPPGTAGSTDFVLRCYYSSPRAEEKLPLFRFHYTDFRGDDLRMDSTAILDVREAISTAHTIVFLIDGVKILDAIEKIPIKGFSISDDLDWISEIVIDYIFKPIQFVITKWDVIDKQYSLTEIRRFLLGHRKFSSVIGLQRKANKSTYLIPVSAIGNNFARYDPASRGSMVKRRHALMEPYNLDVTLALAFSDALLNTFKYNSSLLIRQTFLSRLLGISDKSDDRVKNYALDNITSIQRMRVRNFLSRYPAANLLDCLETDA
jgi:hypothetical protein